MIITVDSNILLSIFTKDSIYEMSSMLMEKYSSSEYIINDCIYIELAVNFQSLEKLNKVLDALEVTLIKPSEIDYGVILSAWTKYLKKKKFVCPSCKKAIRPTCPRCQHTLSYRQRILTDFFIGGFAKANSDGILTLDPTYYRNYFPTIKIYN